MKKIALFIIALQIITIGVLLGRIYINYSKQNVLGVTNISPLNKEGLIFPTDSEFKYYYTLEQSITSYEKRFWDNTIVQYTFNQDGLNEQIDYNTLKPDGVFRIITLGDSFTFGHFVNTKDNWTERLEDLLNKQNTCTKINKFEVVNLGMHGFDIPYIVKRYNDLGLKYHPDLIIWFESGSGFSRDIELMNPYIQDCDAKSPQETQEITSAKTFYKCWNTGYEQMLKVNTLESIQKNLTKWMSSFLTLRNTTPTLFAGFSNFNQSQKDELFKRTKDQSNIFVMDNVSDITKANGTFRADGHPNEVGHTIIAKDIFDYIMSNKTTLIQCD